ncbi:MAG: ribonuclease HI family protein [Candidatus Brocadia sp.]|jgi:Ribonuclease HI|uniref:Ribonuclease H n=1 Tax=Candidatus Brocadia fulgida TaxID=380242 RepID=A0A0M2UUP0_9BACT|nr:MAG: ribonuclease H [Candidatus Brocadia fulgida]UJS20644.1 MAG: ribonuclease HI family protein [Candidatus Brocadia sp.]
MGNMSPQEFIMLISKYLDAEKLIRENPAVTREMINAFFREICQTEERGQDDSCSAPEELPRRGQKDFCKLIIHTDGASRGNPGKAGIGVAIFDKDYHLIEEVCGFLGETTNNVAEYQAMILAARKAVACHAKEVIFRTDSELLVRQLHGAYRVKSANILPLYQELVKLLDKIPAWKIQHVRREDNVIADALANQGIDSRG